MKVRDETVARVCLTITVLGFLWPLEPYIETVIQTLWPNHVTIVIDR